MDDHLWQLTHILLWVIGIQMCILGGVLLFMWWSNLSKRVEDLSQRYDEQTERINEQLMTINELRNEIAQVDKKVYGIELILRMQDIYPSNEEMPFTSEEVEK